MYRHVNLTFYFKFCFSHWSCVLEVYLCKYECTNLIMFIRLVLFEIHIIFGYQIYACTFLVYLEICVCRYIVYLPRATYDISLNRHAHTPSRLLISRAHVPHHHLFTCARACLITSLDRMCDPFRSLLRACFLPEHPPRALRGDPSPVRREKSCLSKKPGASETFLSSAPPLSSL